MTQRTSEMLRSHLRDNVGMPPELLPVARRAILAWHRGQPERTILLPIGMELMGKRVVTAREVVEQLRLDGFVCEGGREYVA